MLDILSCSLTIIVYLNAENPVSFIAYEDEMEKKLSNECSKHCRQDNSYLKT